MENSPSTDRYLPVTSMNSGLGGEVTDDLYCFTVQIVNVAFYGEKDQKDSWVLIDAGMPKSFSKIKKEAEKRFGQHAKPKAIILTHGHFDHVGALHELIEEWDVAIYCHSLELPYLTGEKDYPEPDGTVEGGLIAKMSPLFPHEGISLGSRIHPLPEDGSVPEMPGWKWIHTPGHTEGHISLFRENDSSLIAGDAFVTVKQESLYRVLTQDLDISGPPRYLTTDWKAAWESVKKLAALNPQRAITGHGSPVSGHWLEKHLVILAENFDEIAIPDYGKYV